MTSCAGPAPTPEAPVRRPVARSAINYGHFWSELSWSGGRDADIERGALLASHDLFLTERLTLQLAAGGVSTGELALGSTLITLGPGWVGSVAGAYNILDGSGDLPFVVFSVSLAASAMATRADPPTRVGRLTAVDLRAGLTVGKTLLDRFSPYAAIRGFAGPIGMEVDGEALTGRDKNHYQPALGLVVSLPGGVDLFGEGAPLGERGVTAGLGYTY